MRLAVVGHIEAAEIFRVDHILEPDEVVEATRLREETAGAGATAARQLAKLGAETVFFTAVADDERGHRAHEELERDGVRVQAVYRKGAAQRRAIVQVDDRAERTILIYGEKLCPQGEDPLPWDELAETDGVWFVCGDEAALRLARQTPVLVATARWLPILKRAGVQLDALVRSSTDAAESYRLVELDPAPRLIVETAGARGGSCSEQGGPERTFPPAPVPGEIVDAYGAGDSFDAGLTFALARGDTPEDAVAFAARCGAACLAGEGLSAQLRLGSGAN